VHVCPAEQIRALISDPILAAETQAAQPEFSTFVASAAEVATPVGAAVRPRADPISRRRDP
jgi:hypothetical protein